MSNSFCIPADCHQTLLYERLNNEMTPFLRVVCTDRNGVVTTRDYDLNGDNRSVIGEVLTEPDSRACCSHQIVLHEDLGNCTSAPFIREYSRGTDGALKIENFTLSGISIVPTGQIYTEPLAKTILSKEMCDAGRHETFLRWYASCATGVQTTFDTDTNGAPYTPGDAVYSGSCMCGTVVVKSEICGNPPRFNGVQQ